LTSRAVTPWKVLSVVGTVLAGDMDHQTSFETVLRKVIEINLISYFVMMDYMGHGRAPKARTKDLQLAFRRTLVAL